MKILIRLLFLLTSINFSSAYIKKLAKGLLVGLISERGSNNHYPKKNKFSKIAKSHKNNVSKSDREETSASSNPEAHNKILQLISIERSEIFLEKLKGKQLHVRKKCGFYTQGGEIFYASDNYYKDTITSGVASYYTNNFKRNSLGYKFDSRSHTAAMKSGPLPSVCIVKCQGRQVKVLIDDRGPFVKGRVIDLSKSAAEKLGITKKGIAKVEVKRLPEESIIVANLFYLLIKDKKKYKQYVFNKLRGMGIKIQSIRYFD